MIVSSLIAATITATQPVPAPKPMATPAPAAEKKMACCEKMAKGEGCACCKDMGKKAEADTTENHDGHSGHQ